MKLYTKMPPLLKPYYQQELDLFVAAIKTYDLQQAWHHLERAHIIGQQYPVVHTYVHWKMLQVGIKIKSGREILGQIPRLIFGGVKSFVEKVRIGNTGGAIVPPLKQLAIPEELQAILETPRME